MNTRGAERQSLRQELKAAQDQLDMLKAIQKQMLYGPGTSPKSRPDSFISMTSSISETGEATDSEQTEDGECRSLWMPQTTSSTSRKALKRALALFFDDVT